MPACLDSPTKSISTFASWTNCFGTFTLPNLGVKYVGEWKNGRYHGQGTYTYVDGSKYVGEYKDGIRHGYGTYAWGSGNKYVGEWKNDKRNGQGTYTFANGDKYVGEFKDYKFHGEGTKTYADGRVEEGIWENYEFKYAKKLSPTVTAKKSPLEKAKEQCAEIGFTKGTEKFGDCVMKLLN